MLRRGSHFLRCNFSTGIDKNLKSDVVVVGGGIVGVCTAFHLAKKSPTCKITVIERDFTYKRASTPLSAGGIRHQFSEKENILMSLYGSEFLAENNEENVAQFVEGGYLFLSGAESEQVLKENHATQCELGADVTLLNATELQLRFPWMNVSNIAMGSLGGRCHGWFDPWSFLTSLKNKSKQMGVEFIEASVEQVHRTNDRIESLTFQTMEKKNSIIETGKVVNATGAWAGNFSDLCGALGYPVQRRKRSIFVFHCPDEQIWKGKSASPLVVDANGVWFRREGSAGHFLCGISPSKENDSNCFEDEVLDSPDHYLFEETIWPSIASRVKSFENIKLINAWSGFYDYNTLDQNIIIGTHPDIINLYLVNGFSGHGLQQAPAAGRAVSELIIDGKYSTIDLTSFSFDRIATGSPRYEKNIV